MNLKVIKGWTWAGLGGEKKGRGDVIILSKTKIFLKKRH